MRQPNDSKDTDTRARVIKAASELFATRGYAATSISAIREASGVLPSSIYWEFGSKEGIFAAVLEYAAQRWLHDSSRGIYRAMRKAKDGQFLTGYFDYMAAALAERPEFLRLMLLMALERREGDEKSLALLRAFRQRGIEGITRLFVAAGLVPPDADEQTAHDLARLAVACFDGAFAAAELDGEDTDLPRMFKLLHRALLAIARPCANRQSDL